MSETIALPFWLLAILVFFALWAAYDKLLVPAMRWMVNRPANRVIEVAGR